MKKELIAKEQGEEPLSLLLNTPIYNRKTPMYLKQLTALILKQLRMQIAMRL